MRTTPDVTIGTASEADIEAVAGLFDLYRQFYDQPPDPAKCLRYISNRITRSESIVLLARDEETERPLGFTQLYPTFCSVAAGRIFVLYDLFVADDARRRGIGRMLMEKAEEHARSAGAVRINLETHRTNARAQRLYESLGYERDDNFYSYALTL